MRTQQGSALMETLIALMVLIPAFIAMDYLGRLQEIRRDNIEVGRAASWETTPRPVAHLFTEPSVSDVAGMDRTVDNPLWQRQGETLIAANTTPQIQRYANPNGSMVSAWRVGNNLIAHGWGIPDWVSLLGLSGSMLNLAQERLPISQSAINAAALIDPVTPDKPIVFETSTTLTPDHWMAHSDADYQQRLQQITYSELLTVFTSPAHSVLGFIPFFKEARNARATDFIPESRVHANSRRFNR